MRSFLFAATLLFIANPCLADSPWANGLTEEKLVAVDESTLTLSQMEGRLTLAFGAKGSQPQSTSFAFVSDKMGTVTEDGPKPIGFFRQTDYGLEIQYDDGRSASLFANIADGITMTSRNARGETVCVSWYPESHVFSAAERRAAVAAYAKSLGVTDQPEKPAPKKQKAHEAKVREVKAEPIANTCSPVKHVLRSQPDVPTVTTHTIDPTPPAPAATLPSAPAKTTASVNPPPLPIPTGGGASQCLTLQSAGGFVGFLNHCNNDVQVTYCIMKGTDPTSACGAGTKMGSITAAGFSGVMADNGSGEHDIRWVGCSGGPGDVASDMVHTDPPEGRCVKKTGQ